MSKVIVVGGGAAGMMAAISAAGAGHEVSLYEKNEKLGKKLFITGKGRCNLTNASDMDTIMSQVVHNPKFLYSAFGNLTNTDLCDMFEQAGLKLKTERGNRVFPESDHSSDVIRTLSKLLKEYGVKIYLDSEVSSIVTSGDKCTGIKIGNKVISADAVIVSTGGISYPSTGSTGDGYKWAKATGHKVTKLYPALVPFTLMEEEAKKLMGLSLRNIQASIYDDDKLIYTEFGEMLFTHFGVSGPVLLSASSYAVSLLSERYLTLEIDLKPALNEEVLDARILRDFDEGKNKQLDHALDKLFPSKLIGEVIRQSGIDGAKKVHDITKNEREQLIRATKHLKYTITGVRGFNEAIITQGGIAIKDIVPSTMESKLIHGLYFAGEVLDVDALTGGYNLQIAWSTGYTAGANIPYV